MKVLVVDDCLGTRASYRFLLEHWGYDVRDVADGEAALEAEEAYRPDALLLDVGLPRRDGWDMAGRVRERRAAAHPFVVCVTGWMEAAGPCDAYLEKPVDPDEIRALLARVAARP